MLHAPPEHILHRRDVHRSQSFLGPRLLVHFFWHSSEPSAVPCTSPFMALRIDPLAVRAQVFFPLAVLRSAAQFSYFCLEVPNAVVPEFFQRDHEFHPPPQSCCRCFNFAFVSDCLGISASNRRGTISAKDGPGLVTTVSSLKPLCPRGGVSGDYATRNGYRRSSAEIGEQLLVAFCNNDVSNWNVRMWAVIQGVSMRNWLRGGTGW